LFVCLLVCVLCAWPRTGGLRSAGSPPCVRAQYRKPTTAPHAAARARACAHSSALLRSALATAPLRMRSRGRMWNVRRCMRATRHAAGNVARMGACLTSTYPCGMRRAAQLHPNRAPHGMRGGAAHPKARLAEHRGGHRYSARALGLAIPCGLFVCCAGAPRACNGAPPPNLKLS
jgi:hypothetical protein